MEKRKLIQLAPGLENLNDSEYVSRRFDAKIPVGVVPADVLEPGFWAHHAKTLRPLNEIRACAEDGTWIMELVVVDTSQTWAKVRCLHLHDLSPEEDQTSVDTTISKFVEEHKVVHRGRALWSVVRIADGGVLVDKLQTKESANKWLQDKAREQPITEEAVAA